MSQDPEDEILIEMNRIGHAMEVRAISVADDLEVVFVAPASAARADIEKIAIAKLAYVRRRQGGGGGGPDKPRGGGGIVA